MQFYFLSVFFNLLVGASLTFPNFKITELFPGREKIFKIVVGIAAAFTGLMKFIFVVQPDFVILGDFLPALTGIVGGICYIIDSMSDNTEKTVKLNPFFENLFVKGKKYVGIVSMAVAVIHFIFPALRIL
ncbi:MAG: hypothetical protein K5930_13735 [Treponemataceae bacterium]|nr:hypothetical protein [Treponemataceae bacterium]